MVTEINTSKTLVKQISCNCRLNVIIEDTTQSKKEWAILKYASTHNQPQLTRTTHNHPQPSTTTNNYPQPSTITNKINHNNPKLSATTQKLPKKAKIFHKYLCCCTLDSNTEAVAGFDSEMKQWYIHVCLSLCMYLIRHYVYYFFVRLIVCFC